MAETEQKTCRVDRDRRSAFREKLPEVAERIISGCGDGTCYTHIDFEPIPSRSAVIDILDRFRDILFPGYFQREPIDPVTLRYNLGGAVAELFDALSEQIRRAFRHDCVRYDQACVHCADQGLETALALLREIPAIRIQLATDVAAAYDGDPAARSHDEIIFSYPGIHAITVHRIAHFLHGRNVPLLPRIMSEHAHSVTGIDIHPGAEIGRRFVIDHGTGVVIGETAVIGDNVRLYQGVTLGALSLPPGAGDRLRGKKRHPTIEDDAIIYAGATILGGDTVVGARSVIGGNVWLTESVPPDSHVMIEKPRLVIRSG